MSLSRLVAILSLLVNVLTTAAAVLQVIRPQWAVFMLAVSGAINAFVERVQGGKSKVEAVTDEGMRYPPKE